MAKSLSEILKGVKKSSTAKLTTGSQPGVDYAGKMKDERDFVAQHSLEKHDDRVGNGEDVYAASKVKKAEMKRHGHDPKPKDVLAYNKAQQVSENKHSDSDDQPMYDKKKGKKLLLDKNKKEEECDHDEDEECDCDKKIEEKTLTPAEIAKREEIVKTMKKSLSDFRKRYGDRAKEVMYATATKRAKEVAEETKSSKKKMKSEQTAPADTTIQYPSTAVGDTGRV